MGPIEIAKENILKKVMNSELSAFELENILNYVKSVKRESNEGFIVPDNGEIVDIIKQDGMGWKNLKKWHKKFATFGGRFA